MHLLERVTLLMASGSETDNAASSPESVNEAYFEPTENGNTSRHVDLSAVAKLQTNLQRINSAARKTDALKQLHQNGSSLPFEGRKVASYNDLTRRQECECDVELTDREIRLRAVQRFISAALKGFLIGGGLKGGLALFGILAKLQKQLLSRYDLKTEL